MKDSEAPERAIVSPAVDIWAYGVCVYSMVVGSRPFQDAFQPRVVMAIVAGDWNRALIAEKGGDEVEQLVSGCLEMDDSQRWDISRIVDSAWLEEYAGLDDSRRKLERLAAMSSEWSTPRPDIAQNRRRIVFECLSGTCGNQC